MAAIVSKDIKLPEQLAFHPKFWWDPVPAFLIDRVDTLGLVELTKVQMKLQMNVLKSQLGALEESMKIIEGIR